MAASTWSSRRVAMARSGEKRIRSWLSRCRRPILEQLVDARDGANEPESQDMAHTFDIRFDAAGNSFGWKGAGSLRIDARGLDFARRRGIASLLARRKSERIPAERIREVYREGEGLRVEF